jgi:chromate transport protein ChrA
MTFIKNLLVLVSAIVIVLIAAFLLKMGVDNIVLGLTFLIPTGVLILMIEDFWRKMVDEELRKKQTWQYYVGMLLILSSVVSFLWLSQGSTEKEVLIRLAITIFLGGLGFGWESIFYSKSVRTPEQFQEALGAKENNRWRKISKMATAQGKEKAIRWFADFLKYRVSGNSLGGDLRLEHPIAVYRDTPLTLTELLALTPSDEEATEVNAMIERTRAYIEKLVSQIEKE